MILLIQAALACPDAMSPQDLSARTEAARDAFSRMDAQKFSEIVADIEVGVGCLDSQLSPQQAAEVHTVRALSSFLAADELKTGASLRAALAVHPELSIDWLPPSHPIYFELRYAERTLTDARQGLRPKSGLVVVDGLLVDEVGLNQPAILQHQEGGAVVDSALVSLGEPMPSWAPLAPTPLSPEAKRRLWLGSATATSAVASGVLLGFSAQYRDTYLRNTDPTLFTELERKTNLTSYGSVALAGVTAGLGTALVIAW